MQKKKKLTRRFIVIEGLYMNSGDLPPLPEIVALKHEYKFRLIVDESISFGILGPRGKGISDHFQMPVTP